MANFHFCIIIEWQTGINGCGESNYEPRETIRYSFSISCMRNQSIRTTEAHGRAVQIGSECNWHRDIPPTRIHLILYINTWFEYRLEWTRLPGAMVSPSSSFAHFGSGSFQYALTTCIFTVLVLVEFIIISNTNATMGFFITAILLVFSAVSLIDLYG